MSIPVTVNYSIWVRPLRKTMAVLLLALTVSGCSFALVQGPPEGHESMAYFACTDDREWPTYDLLYAGVTGLLGIVVILAGRSDASAWDPEDGLGVIVISGLHGIAAKKGFEKVSACRQAKLEQAQRSVTLAPVVDWLDELFPVPYLGANALDPVFGGSISNTPKH